MMRRARTLGVLIASTLALSACGEIVADETAAPVREARLADLGTGFAVWESNRTGDWRLWYRSFTNTTPRQLTLDEPGRSHCCPHIAPDGRSIAYLSVPQRATSYPEGGAVGALRVIAIVDGAERTLLESARTYFEHRAAIWHAPGELIAISGDGSTVLLDLASGNARTLIDRPGPFGRGWLLDRSLRHATTGAPGFGRYDAESGRVEAGPTLPGCQPFFSADGRWGYWVAGAGGPIRLRDLATGDDRPLLAKNDPRLPADRGYLYFPMLAPNADLLAWAASDGTHDHDRADYDVFVAETDADTLEIVGAPMRVTDDAATDRFPDIYLAPLGLGRHFGEAPLDLTLQAPVAGDWQWRFLREGQPDATAKMAIGAAIDHRFETPGTYRFEARLGNTIHEGRARVRPPSPPRISRADVTGPRALALTFDEPVDAAPARLRFESGRSIESTSSDGDRTLIVTLRDDFDGPDTLRVEGIRDRASVPNGMAPASIEVGAPTWPSRTDGLLVQWSTAGSGAGGTRAPGLFEPQGRAFTDRHGAMVLEGGTFLADMPTMESLLEGGRASNAISLEMTITPVPDPAAETTSRDEAHIFSFSGGPNRRNLTLSMKGDVLLLRIHTPETARRADPPLRVGTLPRGRASHVVVGYEPGRAVSYIEGALSLDATPATGGFFHWRPLPLQFGDEWQQHHPWRGRVEGIAAYDRVIEADEARENARRYAVLRTERLTTERLTTDRVVVDAVLTATSTIPSLESIAPYDDALAVFAYRVERVVEGAYSHQEVRVVHRVLIGGERLSSASATPGTRTRLVLEPANAHPQLASLYRSETLEPNWDLPLFYALRPAER